MSPTATNGLDHGPDPQQIQAVADLFQKLYIAPTAPECIQQADNLAAYVSEKGIHSLTSYGVLDNIRKAATNKKSGFEREASMIAVRAIAKKLGHAFEPYAISLFPLIFELCADKGDVVREAAEDAAISIINSVPTQATLLVLEALYPVLGGSAKWKSKLSALACLEALTKRAPQEIGDALVKLLPNVTTCMQDTKSDVSKAGLKAGISVCSVIDNSDILPHIPDLVGCMGDPSNVPAVIKKLSNTTFVAEVTGPALAIMVPLLVRALTDRSPTVQRQAVIVVDNLCKLVVDPADAGQFLPPLWPGVDRIATDAAFPQVREFGLAAKSTLEKVGATAGNGAALRDFFAEQKDVEGVVTKIAAERFAVDDFTAISLTFSSGILAEAIYNRDFTEEHWQKSYLGPYIQSFTAEHADIVKAVYAHFLAIDKKKFPAAARDYDDDGVELCNVDFSLAYGGLMLLNHTTLRLMRGRRYGLCGANGAGKSTLMKAIANGKVDNFPPQSEIRSIMVEVTRGSDSTEPLVDTVARDENLTHVSRAEIVRALESVGFDKERQQTGLSTLSGGWLMKLELAKAMLIGADLLLLDEPTNHLDVANVKWLEDYLTSQTDVTCLIVSHDSGFLDNVTTDIIHYEKKKLVYYRGNLRAFVDVKPEAKTYYTLEASQGPKFTLPPPSHLVGVRSMTKAILKMHQCTYTYPGAAKPSLHGVSCAISLSSRIGIVGPNGAGKSTLMKLLTGDSIPQEGAVDKHPNLRIGYVAQHAFHHLNRHPDKTAIKYIQWRYEGGIDKELMEKVSRVMTADDKAQMETEVEGRTGEKRRIESLIGRQKEKKSFKYEVKWQNMDDRHNSWLPRERLLSLGFNKLVQEFDDFIASQEGLGERDMSTKAIRQLLEDVGLNGDIAEYNETGGSGGSGGGLSGGQKVKVVIAASMITNPHILIMDEPTNFLDRDTLASLANAIREWSGGVILISHNQEFISTLCPEVWHVENGRVTHKGAPPAVDSLTVSATGSGATTPAESMPGSGTSTPKSEFKAKKGRKKKSRNELKAQEVRRRLRYLAWLEDDTVDRSKGPPVDSDDD